MKVYLSIVLLIVVMMHVPSIECKSDEQFDAEFLWGTYKPQLVWGLTQRNMETFNPLTMSMMYFDPKNLTDIKDIRYRVPQRPSDKIIFDYQHHDGKTYAEQKITDPLLQTEFTTSYLKISSKADLQEWDSLLTSSINSPFEHLITKKSYISFIYLVHVEQLNDAISDLRYLNIQENQGKKGKQTVITVRGHPGSDFQETFTFTIRAQAAYTQNYSLFEIQRFHSWNVSNPIYNDLKSNFRYPYYALGNTPLDPENKNKTVVALQFIFQRNTFYEVTVSYRGNKKFAQLSDIQLVNDIEMQKKEQLNAQEEENQDEEELQSEKLKNLRKYRIKKIYSKLNLQFRLDKVSIFYKECAVSSHANLLGGFQFVYGNLSCVQSNQTTCDSKKAMFGHTPSRLGFPRPFMWDEGFHNMLTCQMDKLLCLQSLEDWINTVSQDGWIPREQPRGEEVYSFIPGLKEDNREANPPTFMFDFIYLMRNGNAEITQRIQDLFPKIELWYNWWLETQEVQVGGVPVNLFQWWGPDQETNLGSGMDDWPRTDQNKIGQFNVDATAWGYFFTQSMATISSYFDIAKARSYSLKAVNIKRQMEEFHLDPSDYIYQDVLADNTTLENDVFSPHLGYPNFMPLALGLIDASNDTVLSAHAKAMLNQDTIWTKYGLRSISQQDDYFGVGSNYWRGPIWINTHYLILRAIQLYYFNNPDLKIVYKQLRNNIVKTVCSNWKQTGYFWEHFNQDLDGKGRGNHPFNGWTSLITLIINEKYITQ